MTDPIPCPTCGSPTTIIDGDHHTSAFVGYLTGAQVDAAERMAEAIVRMAVAEDWPTQAAAQEDAYLAAADFGHAGGHGLADGLRAPANIMQPANIHELAQAVRAARVAAAGGLGGGDD